MSVPTKVLYLGAQPSNTTDAGLPGEFDRIQSALSLGRFPFTLEPKFEVEVSQIPGLLMKHAPHLVHFGGHGDEDGDLVFLSKDGQARRISNENITEVFRELSSTIRCVVLNACHTLTQARLLSTSTTIETVVGMSSRLTPSQASAFAAGFYEALSYGNSIQSAFRLGRLRPELEDVEDTNAPTLILQAPNLPEVYVTPRDLPIKDDLSETEREIDQPLRGGVTQQQTQTQTRHRLAQAAIEQEFGKQLTDARRYQHSIMIKALDLPNDDDDARAALDQVRRSAIEDYVNVLNEGCEKYLSGCFDRVAFEEMYKDALIELMSDSEISSLVDRIDTRYRHYRVVLQRWRKISHDN